MKIAALFLWPLLPLGLWLAALHWGTPHMLVSYRFYDNGRQYDPFAHREYISCTYWGAAGVITLPASQARCAWVRLLKEAR